MTTIKGMLRKELKAYGSITFGLGLIALGLDLFLVPNKIAAGGISGVATIMFHQLKFPVGTSMLVMNTMLFVIAFRIIGRTFGARSIFASILLSLIIDSLHYVIPIKPFTDDLLIAVIFGDLLTGIGMAVVFNNRASTGGTDILAKILQKYTSIEIGKALLVIDFIVGAMAGVTFGSVKIGMYSLLAILINTFTIDAFLVSINIKKQAFIVSAYPEKIAERILAELDRGVTYLDAQGAYTGKPQKAVLCVVGARQVNQLITIVKETDPQAFLAISNVNEVRGEGFRALHAGE